MVPAMERLNYQHLQYVWMVAREGTVARAAEKLCLTQSTLSSQIHRFEDALGEKLFVRRGRRLELTEAGRIAVRYADEIFSLGKEFLETLRGQAGGRPVRLVVGVLDVMPKPLVEHLLEPAFKVHRDIRIVCREDRSLEGFLAELAVYGVDLVLSDSPASPSLPVRLFNHVLGDSGTSFFATASLARRLRKGFPRSLTGEAMLLPGRTSALHRALEQWFVTEDVRPRVIGEIDDSALLKLFGQAGRGVFAGPAVEEQRVRKRYEVEVVGRVESIRQRFYAISVERRIRHPAVLAITERAKREIFA
jgi:LysR family transcriptional activator of nhaA